jgi:hypothetical protein
VKTFEVAWGGVLSRLLLSLDDICEVGDALRAVLGDVGRVGLLCARLLGEHAIERELESGLWRPLGAVDLGLSVALGESVEVGLLQLRKLDDLLELGAELRDGLVESLAVDALGRRHENDHEYDRRTHARVACNSTCSARYRCWSVRFAACRRLRSRPSSRRASSRVETRTWVALSGMLTGMR